MVCTGTVKINHTISKINHAQNAKIATINAVTNNMLTMIFMISIPLKKITFNGKYCPGRTDKKKPGFLESTSIH